MTKKKLSSTNELPQFLTGRQIKSLLLNSSGSIFDQELADFTRLFYHRLAEANPKRESFNREESNRRLDAMARILVGNETCAAIAYNGGDLLIATNENEHQDNRIITKINWLIKEHDSGVGQYDFYPVIYMSLADTEPVRVKIDNPATYYYKKKDHSLSLTSSSPKKINATLTPDQHLIPDLPQIPMGPHITLKEKIFLSELVTTNLHPALANLGRYHFIKEDIASHPNKEREFEGPTSNLAINSLQRRAEILIKHLINISLLEKSGKEDKQKYITAIDDYRQTVLMNSLAWEASKWYRQDFKDSGAQDRKFLDSKATGINEFIRELNNNFNRFKSKEYNKSLSVLDLIERWIKQAIDFIQSGQIQIPSFIQGKLESFFQKIEQYFIDLVKLEEFIKEEVKRDSAFAKAFLDQGKKLATTFIEQANIDLDPSQSFIKIIDNLDNNVHCEIRILEHFLQNEKLPEYIATSLLCCAHCKLVMDSLKISVISGTHARAYGNWTLPSVFKKNTDFLQKFFGAELYTKYEELTKQTISFNNQQVSKSELALKILENIASLNEEHLKALNITVPRLWNNDRMFADESDDEMNETDNLSNKEEEVPLIESINTLEQSCHDYLL